MACASSDQLMICETLNQIHTLPKVNVLDGAVRNDTIKVDDFLGSAFLVDKPSGWTSYDVIRRLKRYFPKTTKIGHAGTLDPLATGLLILLFGKATKEQDHFLGLPKTYSGTMCLGEDTPSMDSETEVSHRRSIDHLTPKQIESACAAMTGLIQQIPPMYSAVKVKGERLYKKARRGESVIRQPNTVTVYDFKILNIDGANVIFFVRCSKGTYIRVLAHDLGQKLSVGAHLTQLRRTRIGEYHVDQALKVHDLIEVLERQ